MMKILFYVSAVAQDLSGLVSGLSGLRSPLADVTPKQVQETLTSVLGSMKDQDCKKLKTAFGPVTKGLQKRIGNLIDDVGKIAGQINPMAGPMVSMGKSYVETTVKTILDQFVRSHACEYLITQVPPEVRAFLPKLKDFVSYFGDSSKCNELKKSLNSVTVNAIRSTDEMAALLQMQMENEPQWKKWDVKEFITMGKDIFETVASKKLKELVDEHACQVAYGHLEL